MTPYLRRRLLETVNRECAFYRLAPPRPPLTRWQRLRFRLTQRFVAPVSKWLHVKVGGCCSVYEPCPWE